MSERPIGLSIYNPVSTVIGKGMRNVLIFANPLSGRGRGMAILKQVAPAIEAAGFGVVCCVDPPNQFDFGDVPNDLSTIVVIGGDGTLRAVVDRLLRLIGVAEIPPILVIGFGTANLMQAHLRLKYDRRSLAARVVALIEARRTTHIDVGVAGDQAFLLMASCGFDAGVVHALSRLRAGPITKLSYLLPGLDRLRSLEFTPLTVEVDGVVLHTDRPAQVFVGNVAEYGTGFPVLDQADSSDGLLDVCVIPCDDHAALARLAWHVMRGEHRLLPDVRYARGRDIFIHAAKPHSVQIDGEPAGETPARFGLLDARIGFIVP